MNSVSLIGMLIDLPFYAFTNLLIPEYLPRLGN